MTGVGFVIGGALFVSLITFLRLKADLSNVEVVGVLADILELSKLLSFDVLPLAARFFPAIAGFVDIAATLLHSFIGLATLLANQEKVAGMLWSVTKLTVGVLLLPFKASVWEIFDLVAQAASSFLTAGVILGEGAMATGYGILANYDSQEATPIDDWCAQNAGVCTSAPKG